MAEHLCYLYWKSTDLLVNKQVAVTQCFLFCQWSNWWCVYCAGGPEIREDHQWSECGDGSQWPAELQQLPVWVRTNTAHGGLSWSDQTTVSCIVNIKCTCPTMTDLFRVISLQVMVISIQELPLGCVEITFDSNQVYCNPKWSSQWPLPSNGLR